MDEVTRDFLVGYAALWLVLTLGTESEVTADLAAALAVLIAAGATVLYLADAAGNVGLLGPRMNAAPSGAQEEFAA